MYRTPHTILGVLVSAFVVGTGLSVWLTVSRHSTRSPAPACSPISGNQDMYNLGIRIGIYLQLLSTAFVDCFGQPDDAAALGPTNLWFLIALFVALVSATWANAAGGLQVVQQYIIIALGNGISLTLLNGTLRLYPEELAEGSLAALSRFVIWGLWKVYTADFWWRTVGTMPPSPDGCPAFGRFFEAVELTGWFRTLHKVFNLVEWLAWGIRVSPYPFGVILLTVLLVRRIDTKPVSKFVVFATPSSPWDRCI